MNVKDFKCIRVSRDIIKPFVETHHYTKSIRSVTCNYCFGLYHHDTLIGAMIYGRPAIFNQQLRYNSKHPELVMELRRLCCIDDTPKNTESYFISKSLKWLRLNSNIETIISYADTRHNHSGIIYKASNFEYVGQTIKLSSILFEGVLFHKRCLYHKKNGVLTPRAIQLTEALQTGNASWTTPMTKHIFLYDLKKRRRVFSH